jgi:CDP-4-dehydro-6-deoxyglucose reductase
MRVILRLPPNTGFKYVAGQYIDVIGKGAVRRSYSVANAQCNDSRIELQIRKIDGGVMSQYWFCEAKNNDLLRIEGPLGTFSNRLVHAENMIFLATGTGIAPIKAMLEEMAEDHEAICSQSIYIYWGGRKEADIYWEPALSIPNLNFIPVLSQPDSEWNGRTGYVQHALLEDRLDLKNSVVYACGSNEMILDARKMLLEQGLALNKFYSDAFVSSC